MSEFQNLYVCKQTKIRELNLEPDQYATSADITIKNKSGNRKVVHSLDISGNYSIKVFDKANTLIKDVLQPANLSDQSTQISALQNQVSILQAQVAAMQAMISKLDAFARVVDASIFFENYSENGGYTG
jgi:hypothetical protein